MADMPKPRKRPADDNSVYNRPVSSGTESTPKERYAGDTQPMSIPPELYRDSYEDETIYTDEMTDPNEAIYPDEMERQRNFGIPDGYDPYDIPRTRRKRRRTPAASQPSRASCYDEIPASSRPAKRRKHRHSFLGGLLRTVLVLIATVFIMYSALSLVLISKLDQVAPAPRSVTSGSLGHANYIRNVLLIGTDSRNLLQERGRSDSMILLTFNDATHEVCLTSFLRDTYVEIPNRGADRLNAAYSYGGAELLMDTLEHNFDISVDDYVCVSFTGFAGIIDAFGGVKITLTDEEAKAINTILQSEVNTLMGDDVTDGLLPQGGTFLLNGKQALAYARIRYVGNADFERASRQREVMEQITESVKQRALQAVPELLGKQELRVSTNMTTAQLYLLSLRFPLTALYSTRQTQIPANGTWTPANISGAAVLQTDTTANRNLLQQTVFAPNKAPEATP